MSSCSKSQFLLFLIFLFSFSKTFSVYKDEKYLTLEDIAEIGYPLYKIGAIEWYASFSNGGFPRGYAKKSATRNYYQEAYRNHKKQSEKESYKKIKFVQGDYRDISDYLEVDDNNNPYNREKYEEAKMKYRYFASLIESVWNYQKDTVYVEEMNTDEEDFITFIPTCYIDQWLRV